MPSPLPRNQRSQVQDFQNRRENKLICCPGLQRFSCSWRKYMMLSQQLLTGSLFLNCQNVQYLPCTQSNRIAFSALMGKNPRQKSLPTKLWFGGVFLQEKSAFEQYSMDRGAADHCGSTLTLLMQKGLVCLMYLSKPPWIPRVRSWLHLQDPGLAVNRALGIFSF